MLSPYKAIACLPSPHLARLAAVVHRPHLPELQTNMKSFSILLFTLFAIFSVGYTLKSKTQDDDGGDMKALMRELMKGVVAQVQEDEDQKSVAELESTLNDILSQVQDVGGEDGRIQDNEDEDGRLQDEEDEGDGLLALLQEEENGGDGARRQDDEEEGGRLQDDEDEGDGLLALLQEEENGGDGARRQDDEEEGGRLQDDEDEGDGLLALLQEEEDGGDGARRQNDEGDDSTLTFLQDDDDGAVMQEDEDGGGDAIEQGLFGRIFSGIRRFGGRVRSVCNRVSRYSRALNCLPRMEVEMQKADEGDDDLARDLLRRIANLQQDGGEGDAEAQLFGKIFSRVRGFLGRGKKVFKRIRRRIGGLVRGYRGFRRCIRRYRG